MLALLLAPKLEGYGTGLEILPVLSILIPAVVLVGIFWYGSRNAV